MVAVVRFLTTVAFSIAVVIGTGFGLFVILTCIKEAEPAEKHRDTRIRIAIIDTGLDLEDPRFKDVLCESGHRDFTRQTLKDTHGHGTHIAGIIKDRIADKSRYCLMILKYYVDSNLGFQNLQNEIAAIKYATDNGAQVVNISGGGPFESKEELQAIKNAPGVQFIVAAGNDGVNVDGPDNFYYPGSYGLPNITVVGNLDCANQRRSPSSNYGRNTVWRCGTDIQSTAPDGMVGIMSGTSQATAVYTAELINRKIGAIQ